MMLEVAIESDAEWDSSTDWQALARKAAESAIAESAFPQLATSPRAVEISVRLTGDELPYTSTVVLNPSRCTARPAITAGRLKAR